MEKTIQVIEKPEWVSWEDIKCCLMDAHEANRDKGINMAHYQWPVEQIKSSIGDNGVVLVALDGRKVVGTATIMEKEGHSWFARGKYAYLGFAGVLPEYSGMGIYKQLTQRREEIAQKRGYTTIQFDTHSRNRKVQCIAIKNGYQKVSFFRAQSGDHFNVILVKWLKGNPYSSAFCRYRYIRSWIKANLINLIRK